MRVSQLVKYLQQRLIAMTQTIKNKLNKDATFNKQKPQNEQSGLNFGLFI